MNNRELFWSAFFASATVFRAVKIAGIVGTILVVINQWEALVGSASVSWLKLVMTYCVPYLVSSYSAAAQLVQGAGTETKKRVKRTKGMTNIKTISAVEFQQLYNDNQNLALFDVRTEAEFNECHIKGAKLFTLQTLSVANLLEEAEANCVSSPIYLLCKAGGRAMKAANLIASETRRDVVVVDGGTDECVACGFPVNQG